MAFITLAKPRSPLSEYSVTLGALHKAKGMNFVLEKAAKEPCTPSSFGNKNLCRKSWHHELQMGRRCENDCVLQGESVFSGSAFLSLV